MSFGWFLLIGVSILIIIMLYGVIVIGAKSESKMDEIKKDLK